MGKPLNLLRFGVDEWRFEDRALAVALTLFEDSLCGRCGHPRDRAYNPDMEGFYTTRVHHCQACAVLDVDARDAGDKAPEPGRKVGVADDAWDEGYVPSTDVLMRAIRSATGT